MTARGAITTGIDLSDAEIVTALALGANDIAATNWSVAGATGNITTSGDVAVNGGDLNSTSATASLFNTNATTLWIGGAATTISVGAGTGTTTLSNNLTANIRDNTADAIDIQQGTDNYFNINTTNAAENIAFGNGVTNPSFSFLGSGTTTFTGDIAVNGGDITSTSGTFNLVNSGVTTLNIGSDATAVSIGDGLGTTTVNNGLTVTGLATFNGATTASPCS